MNSGIYCIKNLINNKGYIGSAVSFRLRFNCHRSQLNNWKVRVVKRLLESKVLTQIQIGNIFGVHNATISHIKNNRSWRGI